jgi:hypothetical protein
VVDQDAVAVGRIDRVVDPLRTDVERNHDSVPRIGEMLGEKASGPDLPGRSSRAVQQYEEG